MGVTSRVAYVPKGCGVGAEKIFFMAIIHQGGVAGPAAHALNNVVRDSCKEEVGGAAGAERVTAVIFGWQTDNLGGTLNDRVVRDRLAPIKACG